MIRKFMNWLFGKKPATVAKVEEVKPQPENVKANVEDVIKIIDAIEAKTDLLVAQETKVETLKPTTEVKPQQVESKPKPKQEQPRSNQPKPTQPKENKPQPKMNAEPKKDQPKKQEVKQTNQNPTNGKPAHQKNKRGRKPKNNQAPEKKN